MLNTRDHFFKQNFKSFLWGGFECADHLNAFGNRINMYQLTGHIDRLQEDYRNLSSIGIRTVREGLCWSEAEKSPYCYDFSIAEKIMNAAKNEDLQIIWDICHFGFPDDLTPLHPMFACRFASICGAFADFLITGYPADEIYIIPINEVSFLSWLGGDARGTSPYTVNNGWEVKYALMKAYIEGIYKIKEKYPSIKIVSSEPLIHIAPLNYSDPHSVLDAQKAHQNQFQMLDMFTGTICPELGGKPELIDIIGVNFYFNNQWINENHEFIPWGEEPAHPHWKTLSNLISEVYIRYGKPIVITETGHPGEHRANWFEMILKEIVKIQQNGVPLEGCCLYPVVDRPDWDFPENWHHSGIWDIFEESLQRIPYEPLIGCVNTVTAGFQH